MKPDKYKLKEKRVRYLSKRLEELWRYRYSSTRDEEWIPLEEPIRHGYWAEWIPIGKFRGTEHGANLQKAINACTSATWCSNKTFLKRDHLRKGFFVNTFPKLRKVGTWRKYQELPLGSKSQFKKIMEQGSWGGWFDYYYPTPEFKTQIEIKISRAYITHVKIPNSGKQKELDEVKKEYNVLTKFHPKGRWKGYYEPVKVGHNSRRTLVRDNIVKAIKTNNYDLLDQFTLCDVWDYNR